MNGVNFGSYNSWSRWKAMIVDRSFKAPEIKKKHIVIAGRDGVLDATETIANRVLYGNQKITVKFKVVRLLTNQATETSLKSIESDINGKDFAISFDDASNYGFNGRCFVKCDNITHDSLTFTIECDCEPEITKSGTATKTLTSISVGYNGGSVPVGTSVNSLSITVEARYSDGTSQIITNGYTISGSISAGSNTITVSYQGKSSSFIVTGYSNTPVTLTGITVTWYATSAMAGSSTSALVDTVRANYSDGTSKAVSGYSVSPTTLSVGTNNVTVTYQGKTATKTITGTQTSATLFILGTSKLNSSNVLG